jgi:hypothetical protein
VLVVYRSSRSKQDPRHRPPYGETDRGTTAQWEADRMYFPVAKTRQPRVTAAVYVVDGVVTRVRPVLVYPDRATVADGRLGWTGQPARHHLAELSVADREFVARVRPGHAGGSPTATALRWGPPARLRS